MWPFPMMLSSASRSKTRNVTVDMASEITSKSGGKRISLLVYICSDWRHLEDTSLASLRYKPTQFYCSRVKGEEAAVMHHQVSCMR